MMVFTTALAIILGAFMPIIFKPNLEQNSKLRSGLDSNWNKLINLLLGTEDHKAEIAASTKKILEIAIVACLGAYVLMYTSPFIGLALGVLCAVVFTNEIRHFLRNNKLTAARFSKKPVSEKTTSVISPAQTAEN